MKQLAAGMLGAVGFVGLILFGWFDVTEDERRFVLHVGRPMPWLVHERDDHGFRTEANMLTLGGVAGIISVVTFSAAWRLRRPAIPASPEPPAALPGSR